MKTVITKNIDGYQVVVGFGQCAVDGVETRKAVKKELVKTSEHQAVEDKKSAIAAAMKLVAKADKEKRWADKSVHLQQAKGYENEIKGGLIQALKNKEAELTQQHAVYFDPPKYETVKSDAEIDDLRALIESGGGLVCLDGTVLEDNRGIVWALKASGKWAVEKITALGVAVPPSAILYEDLTADQKKEVDLHLEIKKAAMLNPGEKVNARASDEELALNDAAVLRSKLEIQGATDALEQSQAFYNARLAELDVIYG